MSNEICTQFSAQFELRLFAIARSTYNIKQDAQEAEVAVMSAIEDDSWDGAHFIEEAAEIVSRTIANIEEEEAAVANEEESLRWQGLTDHEKAVAGGALYQC